MTNQAWSRPGVVAKRVKLVKAYRFSPGNQKPASIRNQISVNVETRQSPSGKSKYKPKHCGPFHLNKGVKAYDMDNPGEPIAKSNKLCVAAVKNPDANDRWTDCG